MLLAGAARAAGRRGTARPSAPACSRRATSSASRQRAVRSVAAACDNARVERQQSEASLVSLAKAAAADSNNHIAVSAGRPGGGPGGAAAERARSSLQGLQKRVLSAEHFLVPEVWVQPDFPESRGLPLFPPDYARDLCEELRREFGLTFEAGGAACSAFVDPSYSKDFHNGSLVLLGSSLLHLYVRSWVTQHIPARLEKEYKRLVLRLLEPRVLAEVVRNWKSAQYLLTDMPTAKKLGRRCYFSSVVPPSLLRHYAVEGGADDDDDDPDAVAAVRNECYADLVAALVGAVYVDHGIDAAAAFVSRHCAPALPRAALRAWESE